MSMVRLEDGFTNRRFAKWWMGFSFVLLLELAIVATEPRVLYTAGGSRVKSLDPAQADDLASRNLVGAVYDTLLQYDYLKRPYELIPSMLVRMPESNESLDTYCFQLRDDLYFADDPVFVGLPKSARRITSRDVLYSILRVSDARRHSPVYWLYRGKLKGIDEFYQLTAGASPGDFSMYDRGIPGFEILDDLNFRIHLTKSDPRFPYMLAMPNSAIVSWLAEARYGEGLARHPVGSGPFRLTEWISDYRLKLDRNPDYRTEFFAGAETESDRARPLPLVDQVVLFQVKQPMTSWLLFLQGNLDLNEVDKDSLDLVAMGGEELAPALKKRGIRLLRVPEFEVRYVGFNFSDPLLGNNLKLRQALSLGYNVQRRVEHANFQLIPAQGPIPPGVAGFDPDYINPNARDDVEAAQRLMGEAGYPNGCDPVTGKPLHFTFDQTGNSTVYRQLGELATLDFAKIGVDVESVLNNNPRFYEKLRRGKLQLFRLSWAGDYPDAENFLQLFYSGNLGGCNRVGFSDPVYDRMFEEILPMPDSPERTERYRRMVRYLGEKCPWIFEGFPISYLLTQAWLENYHPHDFAFSRWKYLSMDPERRRRLKSTFTPLSMGELRR